jgi:hypothetical protein
MKSSPIFSKGGSRLILIGLWLATCATLIAATWQFIVPLNFRDPDDALRLVQVRDLLAGQSWFDVTQYRILPPGGTPMHWSRLVDLPIALMLMALEPLLGTPLAERITLVVIPLILLLLVALLVYAIARRLALGRGTALLAVTLLLSALSILIQYAPLRIDHHGTQVLYGTLAIWALIRTDRTDGRLGLIAGAATAAWLQVSAEGLPYAVAIGGLYGLRHMLIPGRWRDMRNYVAALTGVSALFLFGTHDLADALVPWCDSLSPAYLLPLMLVTGVMLGVHPLTGDATLIRRTLPLVLAGAAGAGSFLLIARDCLAGPFQSLDPIVYQLWYLAVREGLPIWDQKPDLQAIILVPALLGFAGSALALARTRAASEREAWASLLVMQIVAFAVSLSVMRAMAFAHVVALPGNAVLVIALMQQAQRLRLAPLRVLLTASCVLATPIGASAIITALLNSGEPEAGNASGVPDRFHCTTYATLRGLDALPPALLFTPLDIGAHMLVYTRHSVIATGHHRNAIGMKEVLQAFTATPDAARQIVGDSGARYLVLCLGENEIERYRTLYPHSLSAALARGRAPTWLEPVPMRPGEPVKVYRIARPAA